MVERVAVLIGTVQLQLAVKVVVPDEGAAPVAIEKVALETIGGGYGNWMLLDDLGIGTILPLHSEDFTEVRLQRVQTSVPDDQQPEVLWEREE